MKKLFLILFSCGLFFSMTSFNSVTNVEIEEEFYDCWLTITIQDSETGQSTTETYYSNQRTGPQDCLDGVNAFLAGNFMQSWDFRRSPVLAPN
jgi:hypothetical protein